MNEHLRPETDSPSLYDTNGHRQSCLRWPLRAHVADMVVFKPIDDGDSSTATALYAVSTAGDAYVSVLCNFANCAASKLFIVNSQEGLDALSTKDSTYIVTGATVSDCTPVGLIYGSSQSSPSSWACLGHRR